MPYTGIEDLRSSKLYGRMKMMHSWTQDQMAKFVEVFNAVYGKAKSEGAEEAEAESTAIPIALGAARRIVSSSFMANVEVARHYFVPMYHHQMGRNVSGSLAGVSYKFRAMKKYWEQLRQAVSGISFNHEHDHAAPVGVIRDLLTAEQAGSMGLDVPKDAPFVMAASYMKNVGPAVRNEPRISAEWLEFKASDGEMEAIPISFAVTETPLNGEVLGVKRIASLMVEAKRGAVLKAKQRNKLDSSSFGCPKDRKFPISDKRHVQNALARLSQKHTSECSDDYIRKRIHAAAKHFGVEVGKTAAMVASEGQAMAYLHNSAVSSTRGRRMADNPANQTSDPKLVALEAKVASMAIEVEASKTSATEAARARAAAEVELQALKVKVASYEAERNEREASEAAQVLVVGGKIAREDAPFWSGQYKTLGKETFNAIAAKLQRTTIGVGQAKAAAAVETGVNLDSPENRVMLASLDPKRFGGKKPKAGA